MEQINQKAKELVDLILQDYKGDEAINQVSVFDQPDRSQVYDILDKLIQIVYPGFFREKSYRFYNIESRVSVIIEDVIFNLRRQIPVALKQKSEYADYNSEMLDEAAGKITEAFIRRIPHIRHMVETDVQAAFDGDPAAFNHNEIILCYPGLKAITTARIAHELYLLGVPIIPRIMTEKAHSETGIDIHPGATIGEYFCIDHGTGIVVGETTVIGNYVKLYQGVTIGALSTRGGQSLRGVKRHPTIEDRVTIYAGASILGGNTVIGQDAVIGSNVFITASVEPGAKVSIKSQELVIRGGKDHDSIEASVDK